LWAPVSTQTVHRADVDEVPSWQWDQRFLLTIFSFVVVGLLAFWPFRLRAGSQ
jgi:hypothetical protein